MNFEVLLNQVKNSQSLENFIIPKSWAQGRTVFGGLSATLVYAAMRKQIKAERLLRSMNVSFVGPLMVEEAFSIEVEVLREGGSVSQVLARAVQNNQTCVLLQASFGLERKSRINVDSRIKHNLPIPEKGLLAPNIKGITPTFLEHFELAFCSGGMPFSNSESDELSGWMRFSQTIEEPTEAPTDEHLIALIDVWPPTVLQMFDGIAPSSSLSWNLEFIHPHTPLKSNSWFAYKAITRQAASGYSHTEANIWNEDNELIAISRQVVVAYQ